ncbi:MAG: S41 family peptidase [Saprospiraceae bacterium]
MRTLTIIVLAISIISCNKKSFDSVSIWQEFWTYTDQHYIFFKQKEVNWDSINAIFQPLIDENTEDEELFEKINTAILALKDSHCRIYGLNKIGKTFDFTYEVANAFDFNLIQNKYLSTDLDSVGQMYISHIGDSIQYVYIKTMNDYAYLHDILIQLENSTYSKLIIDIRNNGGGDSNAIPDLLGTLVNEKTYLGAYIEKSGPKHQDVTQPLPVYAFPNGHKNHKKIFLLIDDRCYSASSYAAAMMKGLPNVTLIGAKTSGGGGGNLPYQLSNGWIISVSVSDFLDKEGQSIEKGVSPDIMVDIDISDFGKTDKVLDTAINQ